MFQHDWNITFKYLDIFTERTKAASAAFHKRTKTLKYCALRNMVCMNLMDEELFSFKKTQDIQSGYNFSRF